MYIDELERKYRNQQKTIEKLGGENAKFRMAVNNIKKDIKDFKAATHTNYLAVWDVISCDKVLEIIDKHMEGLIG